jgi:heptosyltransferase-1
MPDTHPELFKFRLAPRLCENQSLHTQSKYRLLVVRLGAMGDILHALPAVTALRQTHPAWVIDWVVEPRWRALLATEESIARPAPRSSAHPLPTQPLPAQPLIDRLHFAPTRVWRKAPFSSKTIHGIKALRLALRAGEYDAVLDLQGAVRSAVVARLTGCVRVIGEDRPRERAARWLFTELVATHGAHVIEQDLELASAIAGDALIPVAPWLPTDPAAEAWADEILPPAAPHPAVLINPGAGWGAKRWPVERYAAVARGLVERGCRVLVNAGPGEEPLAEVIARETGGEATPLACTLDQLIAFTRRIALAVAGDTGPLHLACALGRPVVGIYGPTDPSRNGPFGTRFEVLRSPGSRRDHTRREAPESGLLTIQPDEVLRAADRLLYPDHGSTDSGLQPQ